ncbi:MAG TPA: uracil-DNA glycosylase [Thermopetrobacter sp.]|nr:uracil-DNA glycosylase [Thermopetrobacter sp.]
MRNDAVTGGTNERARWLEQLRWQVEMGADEAIAEAPVNRLAPMPQAAPAPSPAPAAQLDQAAQCRTLEEIFAALDAMADFRLRRTATHTVHADGHPNARVMLIGEAPGRDEDLRGKPFVGRSGQLLDRMLAAIGLSRQAEDPEKAVLISNVVFWRPPGNRKPTEAEVNHCAPWIARTIEIVDPAIIVCLGATPARVLTGSTQGITRLRGNWLDYPLNGRAVPLLPTLHPAYLLRQPLQKRLAWRDFLSLKLRLAETGK